MGAMFEYPLTSETLPPEELAAITGASRKADQETWLKKNGWVFFLNRAGAPVVGRLYARMKLAGINPADVASNDAGWSLDLSRVR